MDVGICHGDGHVGAHVDGALDAQVLRVSVRIPMAEQEMDRDLWVEPFSLP